MPRLLVMLLVGFCAATAARSASAYDLENRWSSTVTNGGAGSQGSPITLTWSFVDDGTSIPEAKLGDATIPAGPSSLISFLDSEFGAGPGGSDYTQRPWYSLYADSFQRLSELSGVDYVYQVEGSNPGGISQSNSGDLSGSNARGDVRIAANSFGSGVGGTLAYNYFPNYSDQILNTDKGSFFDNAANNYRGFRDTIMHEAMHGLGANHIESSNANFLMEPIINTAFDGPQLDDILALQRNYGDVYEKHGGNDVASKAVALGVVSRNQSVAIGSAGSSTVVGANETDFVSIDDNSDADYYSFTINQTSNVTIDLSPQGAVYQIGPQGESQSQFDSRALSDLTLRLYDTNGSFELGISNSSGVGGSEELSAALNPGTYYARVSGAQDDVQLYQLSVFAPGDPLNLRWTGAVSSSWSVAGAANFSDNGGPASFANLDSVRFDDLSTRKNVTLDGSISAGAVVFAAAGDYTLSGTGSLVAGSLTLDGAGTVTLANSGNSYSGPTQINSGTLRLTGNLSAMQSAITVASGGTLVMNPTDAGAMSSTFEIQPGGELHLGEQGVTTTASVFPDNPVSLVNNGVIRMNDYEAISNVSGAGDVVVESQTAFFRSGSNFTGQVFVRSGARAVVESNQGLGSSAGNTVVDAGGALASGTTLAIADDLAVAGEVEVFAGANLTLTGANVWQAGSSITGNGTLTGDVTTAGRIAPGIAVANTERPAAPIATFTLSDDLTLTATSTLDFEIGGDQAEQFDQLVVGGATTLAGMLQVELVDLGSGALNPQLGDSFTLLDSSGGLSGQFDSLALPALDAGLTWSVEESATSLSLSVVHLLAADFDSSGAVDGIDLMDWQAGYGATSGAGRTDGDANHDAAVDGFDFLVWQREFSDGATTALASSAAVPEPNGLWLALLGLFTLGSRRPLRLTNRVVDR